MESVLMDSNKIIAKIGIIDNITFPCFARIVYEINGKTYIQIHNDDGFKFEEINVYDGCAQIEFPKNIFLSKDTENYCIVLSEEEIICGTKEEIYVLMKDKIKRCDLFFQAMYYSFMRDFVNLKFVCLEYLKDKNIGNNTKRWIKSLLEESLREIELVIKKFSAILRKNRLQYFKYKRHQERVELGTTRFLSKNKASVRMYANSSLEGRCFVKIGGDLDVGDNIKRRSTSVKCAGEKTRVKYSSLVKCARQLMLGEKIVRQKEIQRILEAYYRIKL